jgi:hypothetical protein
MQLTLASDEEMAEQVRQLIISYPMMILEKRQDVI